MASDVNQPFDADQAPSSAAELNDAGFQVPG